MIKKLILIVVLAIAVLAITQPALASGAPVAPGIVYVDAAYKGTEDGTQATPYNTIDEGKALARSHPGGAWVYIKQSDGSWLKCIYVRPVWPGHTGTALNNAALYAILASVAVALMLVGWKFQKRARQIPA